eukprot:CAMPEP_0114679928 /NCGR_PEP_ID=MMETSP0191-20121206/53483_1 /TAXON_ID=126664 /ORGANISM="Sorites sp." /LENGTH=56 /DNA_ID=CAMNT_0001955931 /DNA_START=46 /DNA_END=213 /DNA_ORIENTATION=+
MAEGLDGSWVATTGNTQPAPGPRSRPPRVGHFAASTYKSAAAKPAGFSSNDTMKLE